MCTQKVLREIVFHLQSLAKKLFNSKWPGSSYWGKIGFYHTKQIAH